jgi:hypothetical protein
MLKRMHEDFVATPDEGRKRYLFYYMLFVACKVSNSAKKLMFEPFFSSASPEFVYNALSKMEDYRSVHDAVREAGSGLLRAARNIFPMPYVDDRMALEIKGTTVSLTNKDNLTIKVRVTPHRDGPRTRAQIGYNKRPPATAKPKPRADRLGVPVKRKKRKERIDALAMMYPQSLITDWSHGRYAISPSNNKCTGAVVITMKNAQMADQFTDYLLAVSGEVGEWVAQQWDKTTGMKQRRAFVKAIYKRAEEKLSAKKYGEWAMRFVTSMIKDDFLTKEAESIVTNWGVAHGAAKRVKHSVYKNLMDRLANIYVPA